MSASQNNMLLWSLIAKTSEKLILFNWISDGKTKMLLESESMLIDWFTDWWVSQHIYAENMSKILNYKISINNRQLTKTSIQWYEDIKSSFLYFSKQVNLFHKR